MTQNAEVFRTPAFRIKNKKCVPGETIRSIKKWHQEVNTYSWGCSYKSQLLSLYLTTHLQSFPPTSSAGLDCHEHSLPADPVTPKPKPQQFHADEIKIELDLLLIFLNGYYLQLLLSVRKKSHSPLSGYPHLERHHLLPPSSVSQGSHPHPSSSTTALHTAAATITSSQPQESLLLKALFVSCITSRARWAFD